MSEVQKLFMKKNPLLNISPQLVQEAVLLLLIPFLLIFASTQYSLTDPQILVISGGVFTALLMYFLFFRSRPIWSIELPVLACFLVLIVTSFTSIDPRRSFIEAWLISVELFIFLFFIKLVQRSLKPEVIIRAVLVVGAIFMVLSWGEVGQWYVHWLSLHPGQWFPMASYRLPAPNFICVVLNVWLMLAIARFWWSDSKLERGLLGLYGLSSLALIYLTSSRGGWIGTLAGFGMLFLVAVYLAPEKWGQIWRKIRSIRGGVAGLVFIVLAGLLLFAWMMIRQDFQPSHSPLLQSRTYLWGPAWHAFLSSPLIGKGPFTFVSQYLQENSVPPGYFFDYAHSVYLDILSSSGILGLIAAGWLVFAVLRVLVKPLRHVEPSIKAVLVGSIGALAAFAVHGLFDSVHHTVPSSAWNLAIILGTSVGAATMSGSESRPNKKVSVTAAIGFAVVLGFFANAWFITPMIQGVEAADRGLWSEAADQFALAAERDPYTAITHQQAGMTSSILLEQSGEKKDLQDAINFFEEAVRLDPNWALNHANLGALYSKNGQNDLARQQFEEAVRLAPGSAVYQLNLGSILETLGEGEAALEVYQVVLSQNPTWKTASYWEETDLRKDFIQNWIVDHPEKDYPLEELKELYGRYPDSPEIVEKIIQAYLAVGETGEAEKVYQASLSNNFLAYHGVEIKWLGAEIAAQKGDFATAVNLGSSAVDTLEFQGVPGPGFGLSSAYANFMFRSRAVGQDSVPQMTRILFTNEWKERLLELEHWYTELGQVPDAENIADMIVKYFATGLK